MTELQCKLIELMKEFDKHCQDNNLQYFVIGNQLLYSARGEALHGYGIHVAMFYKDWKKFVNLKKVKENADREIESVLDGGNMPGCFFRYVAADTILLDVDHFKAYKKHGISIGVHIFRKQCFLSRVLSFFERGMSDHFYRKKTKPAYIANFSKIVFRKFYSRLLMHMLQRVVATSPKQPTSLKENEKKKYAYGKNFWSKRTKIKIAGESFYTVKDYEKYLRKTYGDKWKSVKPIEHKEHYRCMTSVTLPYKNYVETLNSKRLLTRKFLRDSAEFIKDYEEFMVLHKYEKKVWDRTMFATGERIRLWKKYMPMKGQLLELAEEGKFDEVQLLLDDYIQVITQFQEEEIVICFDADLFKLVLKIFRRNGKTAYADKLERTVTQADLEPMTLEV